MSEPLAWTLGVLGFILVLMVSVAIHEAGHMVVAKRLGVSVPKFFVGFGPTLWSTTRGGTEYGLKALPLGGFIQVQDISQEEGTMAREALSYVAPWKRILIYLAGPAVNLVVGTVAFFALLMATPMVIGTSTVALVDPCGKGVTCAATQAGVRPGDTILSVGGVPIEDGRSFPQVLHPGATTVKVSRGGKEINLPMTLGADGRMGITLTGKEAARSAGDAFELVGEVYSRSFRAVGAIPGSIPHLFNVVIGQEERDPEGAASIIGAGKVYGHTAATNTMETDTKMRAFVAYSALLNIGLGAANLLPFLPLDGGRVFIALGDSLRMAWARLRRVQYYPTSDFAVKSFTILMGLVIVSYMGLLFLADIFQPIPLS